MPNPNDTSSSALDKQIEIKNQELNLKLSNITSLQKDESNLEKTNKEKQAENDGLDDTIKNKESVIRGLDNKEKNLISGNSDKLNKKGELEKSIETLEQDELNSKKRLDDFDIEKEKRSKRNQELLNDTLQFERNNNEEEAKWEELKDRRLKFEEKEGAYKKMVDVLKDIVKKYS